MPSDVTSDMPGEIAGHIAFEITTESIGKVNISSKDVIPIPRVISGYGWSESNFRITIISVRVVDIEIPNVDGQLPESISRRAKPNQPAPIRSEEHTSELQSLMRISYAVFCLKKKKTKTHIKTHHYIQTTSTRNRQYKIHQE